MIEERVYYMSPKLRVFCDNTLGRAVIMFKLPGEPSEADMKEVNRILTLCQMAPIGNPNFINGKWYQALKEGGEL